MKQGGALSNMLTCRRIEKFLEHVKTGQWQRNHPGQRNIPCVSDTGVVSSPCFRLCLQACWERQARLPWGKNTLITADSYLRSCRSPEGMVVYLDLLNYGEAVNRLSNGLLRSVFPYIHFAQHGAAAVSGCSIPSLQPARVDEYTLPSGIAVTPTLLLWILLLTTPDQSFLNFRLCGQSQNDTETTVDLKSTDFNRSIKVQTLQQVCFL